MVLCIVGPTACYKTETAIMLAEHYGGEIISCDSVSIYKGLDIGSAKPNQVERDIVPHHLIDVAEPNDRAFSVSIYKKLADEAIMKCASKNRIPIVCGGSGLYYDSIMHEMGYGCPSSSDVRNRLSFEYDIDPISFRNRLEQVDPITAERIPIRDKKRLVRAMEVYILTGKRFSDMNQAYSEAQKTFRYESIRIGLCLPREKLYARIDARVDYMIENGLLDEVSRLISQGLDSSFPSMQSIGYKQLVLYCEGKISFQEAVEEIKKATRHLAKRQLTWFKRDREMKWFDCSDMNITKNDIIRFIDERIYALS